MCEKPQPIKRARTPIRYRRVRRRRKGARNRTHAESQDGEVVNALELHVVTRLGYFTPPEIECSDETRTEHNMRGHAVAVAMVVGVLVVVVVQFRQTQ